MKSWFFLDLDDQSFLQNYYVIDNSFHIFKGPEHLKTSDADFSISR